MGLVESSRADLSPRSRSHQKLQRLQNDAGLQLLHCTSIDPSQSQRLNAHLTQLQRDWLDTKPACLLAESPVWPDTHLSAHSYQQIPAQRAAAGAEEALHQHSSDKLEHEAFMIQCQD